MSHVGIARFAVAGVGDRPVKMAYIHAHDHNGALQLRQRARERLNITEEFDSEMGISVAINLGPGALGIVAIPEQ